MFSKFFGRLYRDLLHASIGMLLLVPSIALADPVKSAFFFEDALRAMSEGLLQNAFIEVKNALQEQPENLAARMLLGRIFLIQGNGAAAESTFRQAQRFGAKEDILLVPIATALQMQEKYLTLFEEITPGLRAPKLEAQIHAARGKAYFAQGEIVKAEFEFELGIDLEPLEIESIVGQAAIYLQRNELDLASERLDSALAADPDHSLAWYLLAETARRKNDLSAALNHVNKAIELDPFNFTARYTRIELYFMTSNFDMMPVELKFAEEIRPLDSELNYLGAMFHSIQGNEEEMSRSLQLMTEAIDGTSRRALETRPKLMLMYGIAKFRQKKIIEAAGIFNRYLRQWPAQPIAMKLLGGILLRDGEIAKAIELLGQAQKISPNDPQILALLGSAHLKSGETALGTSLLEQAVRIGPNSPGFRQQLALARLAVGKGDEALNELEKILFFDESTIQAPSIIGFIYLNRGDFYIALKWADEIERRAPKSATAESLRGAAYSGLNRSVESRSSFNKALLLEPDNLSVKYSLVELDMADRQWEKAREQLKEIIESYPEEIRALAQLAKLAQRDGDTEQAIRWYKRIKYADVNAVTHQVELLELYLEIGEFKEAKSLAEELGYTHPRHKRALLGIGRVQIAGEDRPAATLTFRRMADLAGHDPQELTIIADYQMQANDPMGARWSLKKALNNNTKFLPAMILMAKLGIRSGRTDEALKIADEIQSLSPLSPHGYQLKGETLLRAGRTDEAIASFELGMMKSPRAEMAIGLATALVQSSELRDNKTRAKTVLVEWLNTYPDDQKVRGQLAMIHYQIGEYQEAVEIFTALEKKAPGDAETLNALALCYQKLLDPRALDSARKAAELMPRAGHILDTYGWLLVQNSSNTLGLKQLREALVQSPQEAVIRYHLAVALYKLGREKEALKELRSAIRSDQHFDGRTDALSLHDVLSLTVLQ
ncbi:MAG: putative PEP-CTERM system TPR-repeat lipoprotein [Gammaproteobacteria bacterium]|jgi:putative PEP-CTERM system TPR-repeat lipoprotein